MAALRSGSEPLDLSSKLKLARFDKVGLRAILRPESRCGVCHEVQSILLANPNCTHTACEQCWLSHAEDQMRLVTNPCCKTPGLKAKCLLPGCRHYLSQSILKHAGEQSAELAALLWQHSQQTCLDPPDDEICPVCCESTPLLLSNQHCGHAACDACWATWAEARLPHCVSLCLPYPDCFGDCCNYRMAEALWTRVGERSDTCLSFAREVNKELLRLKRTTGEQLIAGTRTSPLTCQICLESRFHLIRNKDCDHAACDDCWTLWAMSQLDTCLTNKMARPRCFGQRCDCVMMGGAWTNACHRSSEVRRFGASVDLSLQHMKTTMGSRILPSHAKSGLKCPICQDLCLALISNPGCDHAACESCWRSWAEAQLSLCHSKRKRRPRCVGIHCCEPMDEGVWLHTCSISTSVSEFNQKLESEVARLTSTAGRHLDFPVQQSQSGHICPVCFEHSLALIRNPDCDHAACERCWSSWAKARLLHCNAERTLRPHCFGTRCTCAMAPEIWHHIRSLSTSAASFGSLADLDVARIERTAGSEPLMLSLHATGLQCIVCLENRPVLLRNSENCSHAACESCWIAWAEERLPMLEEKQSRRPPCIASCCNQTMASSIWRHACAYSDALRVFARDADAIIQRLTATAADVLCWPPMACEPGLVCPVCREYCFALLSNVECEHTACEECWTTWAESQLYHCRGQRRADVRCLGPECRQRAVSTIWSHASTISDEVKHLDAVFAKRGRLQANQLYPEEMQVECPRAECLGLAYRGFDTLMCFFCEHQWSDDAGVAPPLMIGDELATGLNMKQCPSCKGHIIKNGGCDHMKCRCGYEFWWTTLQPYHLR